MKCPNCEGRESVEIDTHSEGFTPDEYPVMECGACGLVWGVKMVDDQMVIDVIKPAPQ